MDAKGREELYSTLKWLAHCEGMLNVVKTLLESAEEEEDKDLQLPQVAMVFELESSDHQNEPCVKQSKSIGAFERSCHDQAKGFIETFKSGEFLQGMNRQSSSHSSPQMPLQR